jgi:iron complex transport system permease protein
VRPRAGARWGWIVASLAVLLLVAAVSVMTGPAGLGWRGALLEVVDLVPFVDVDSGLSEQQQAILLQLRLPRVALGALVGGMLALAGAAYQGVFRNPLADPYLLGVASGAGLGATLAIAGLGARHGWILGALPVFAFIGALAGVAATWSLGTSVGRGGGGRTATSLILAGVAVGAFANAVQTFVQQRNSDTLREVYSWILGQLGTSGWQEVGLVLPYVVVASGAIFMHRRLLDVLAVGVDEAATLGVATNRVRLIVIGAATLGTAAIVAVSGLIGFVGIVVPHTVRLLVGSGHRALLPLSMILGAAFLVAVDVVARTAMAPAELPIGVVTAFIGAPFFVMVLRRSARMVG